MEGTTTGDLMRGERPYQKLKTKGLGIKLRQNYEVLDCDIATELSYEIASANIRTVEKILEERKVISPEECKLIEKILSSNKKFEKCVEK